MTYLDRIQIYLDDLEWTMDLLQWRSGLKESIEEHLQQDKIDNLLLYTIIFTITKQYPKEKHWEIFHNITFNTFGKDT
tara:strand:- start:1031 stop:1264 length:234 start_codon:yes stop_codon:yes gene_type:complete